MKIHLLISGWDRERSIWGCMRLGADKIYVIVPEPHEREGIESWWNKKTRKVAEEMKKKFSKYFKIELLPVIYEDYIDCFKKIIKVIREEKERGNDVYVNISSGSHVATSAAIFAASLTKCKAYYVIAKRYDNVLKEKDRFISYGGRSVIEVPLLPISYMSTVEIELLKIIQKEGRIAVSELARKARNLFTVPTRSKFNYYVRKLEDSGFLDNEIISGKLYTKITDSGRMIIEAFS
jgi:predicted transcriptional regulator